LLAIAAGAADQVSALLHEQQNMLKLIFGGEV
jgi:hypothetical protein